MECAAGRAVDQPLVRHVLQQSLEVDLVLTGKPERPRNLPLARRLVRRSDKIEDLFSAWQAGSALPGHGLDYAESRKMFIRCTQV
jgi:hypothetical protein